MWSLSLVVSECSLSGRSQGHVSNFYIVDLENFATASRRYTGDIHNSTVVGLFMTRCLQLNFQLHTIGLVRTCRISSFCTVAWQLARLLLTRRIVRSLGDSWATCTVNMIVCDVEKCFSFSNTVGTASHMHFPIHVYCVNILQLIV